LSAPRISEQEGDPAVDLAEIVLHDVAVLHHESHFLELCDSEPCGKGPKRNLYAARDRNPRPSRDFTLTEKRLPTIVNYLNEKFAPQLNARFIRVTNAMLPGSFTLMVIERDPATP